MGNGITSTSTAAKGFQNYLNDWRRAPNETTAEELKTGIQGNCGVARDLVSADEAQELKQKLEAIILAGESNFEGGVGNYAGQKGMSRADAWESCEAGIAETEELQAQRAANPDASPRPTAYSDERNAFQKFGDWLFSPILAPFKSAFGDRGY